MVTFLADWFEALWMILAESGPFLLVGFLIAGFLAVFVPTRWVARRLGGDDIKSVATAAVIGVPVPLCSCSVIPTATQLRRSGASRGATTSFLIATPETGVDSIGATWALMDPLMTVVRPIAAFITAFAAGVAVNVIGKGELGPLEKESLETNSGGAVSTGAVSTGAVSTGEVSTGEGEPEVGASCCSHGGAAEPDAELSEGDHDHDHASGEDGRVVPRAFRYAFGTLLDDLTPWFLIGFALSAIIVVAVPEGFFAGTLFTGWAAMLAMLIAGVPLYVCATASTPIAAAMMAKGLEPGAALVFLLAGPATNIATILVVRNLLGKRALVAYLSSIALVSLLIGSVVNVLYPLLGFDPTDMDVTPGAMEHGLISTAAGALLALLLTRSTLRLRLDRKLGAWLRKAGGPIGLDLTARPVKAVAIAALLLTYASTAVTVVGPGETVFVERFGRVAHERAEPGAILHAPWPVDRSARVATSAVRSIEFGIDRSPIDDSTIDALALREERMRIARLDAESETLTGDGLLLSIRFAAQYRVIDARLWRYGQSEPEALVARLAQDALRRAVATRDADDVLVGESDPFVQDVESRLTADLRSAGLGAELVGVTLHDVHAPPAVHDAYRAVASAMEDAITVEKKAQVTRIERLSEARAAAREATTRAESDGLATVASARGVAAAFEALVAVHTASPETVERSMLVDAFERAMRPDAEGGRRVVLTLGDAIEIITRINTTSEPPPAVFDEAFAPGR